MRVQQGPVMDSDGYTWPAMPEVVMASDFDAAQELLAQIRRIVSEASPWDDGYRESFIEIKTLLETA
jgi:hypothetical protein